MISVLHLGLLDYGTALELQKSLVELRKQGAISDVLLLLEHPPVITLGRNASRKNLLASAETLASRGVELCESDRGGDVTFHGPGQLIGYPIFDLRSFSPRIGAVEFVRRVEEALIRTCGDLGILCERISGLTGVWTQGAGQEKTFAGKGEAQPVARRRSSQDSSLAPALRKGQKKIAAIGVHISRGVTSHGFALNVATDLEYFKLIVPCGLNHGSVTSIVRELGRERSRPTVEQVAHAVSLNFGRVFEKQMLWLESLDAILSTAVTASGPAESTSPSDSTTIDIPLKVPQGLRELRREQRAPQLTNEDELFWV